MRTSAYYTKSIGDIRDHVNAVFHEMSDYATLSKKADRHFINRLNKIFGKKTKAKKQKHPLPVLRVFSLKQAMHWRKILAPANLDDKDRLM